MSFQNTTHASDKETMMRTLEIYLKMFTDYLLLFIVYHVNCYYYQTFAKSLCILVHRVLVSNPIFSISSPGFQKSSPSFLKDESGFFSSPGFSRVRIFFESGIFSSPDFLRVRVRIRAGTRHIRTHMIFYTKYYISLSNQRIGSDIFTRSPGR